ncbi:hypothetical protein [Limnochorda pilosa]|uniref:WxL domain-containing protein n=1 Tax=Limnochorda pilosa TaxID=1555112 RepID=A0A0K2SGI0_LIMPI|nr:hypothetical protein [Limnochorda pilosa]BAS25954.1 hypothetical protein LIP_0097 [Limnochorda pilosa]
MSRTLRRLLGTALIPVLTVGLVALSLVVQAEFGLSGSVALAQETEETDQEPAPPTEATDSKEVNTQWSITRWILLDVDSPVVQLGQSDGSQDLELLEANRLSVQSNAEWVMTVQATSDTIAYDGPADDPNKPVSDFLFRVNGSDAQYASIPGAGEEPAVVFEGPSGSTTVPVDYMVDVKDTDPMGNYSATLLYTTTTR